jgi:hypothetical protein
MTRRNKIYFRQQKLMIYKSAVYLKNLTVFLKISNPQVQNRKNKWKINTASTIR